jgi:hypothetical protein
MKILKGWFLIIITLLLIGYYLFCAVYLNKLGYFSHESLFYIEKARIIFDGIGNRLKVMGLTTPILPFYCTFVFAIFNYTYSPILASAIGTGILFYLIASTMVKRLNDDFYLLILLILFLFHPGLLYAACSGKSIYIVLIFVYLFFFNIIKFYTSNTTFHISIASICLVFLIFCDYKFVWLTLFFIPLTLSITIQSLNLSEQESIFRLFLSFNSTTLRRKLINKTFAIYIIIFSLPIASIFIYKMLNLTHADNVDYFIDSPYATWNVLADRASVDKVTNIYNTASYLSPQTSLLTTLSVLWFCPMMIVAVYLFRQKTYQVLTLLTPFAFIEFLQIKYDNVYLMYEYFLIFIILAILCLIIKAKTVKNQLALKTVLMVITFFQLYSGYFFLKNSSIADEQNFITDLIKRKDDGKHNGDRDMAAFMSSLPDNSHILVDDAIAYPVIAFTTNMKNLTLPYEDAFLSALESPGRYNDYMLLATPANEQTGYTQLNDKYLDILKRNFSKLSIKKVYETPDWTLYRVL